MRKIIIMSVATAAIVAVSAAACGGGKSATDAGGTATPAAATRAADAATSPAAPAHGSLVDAMLTASELPPGWSQLPDDNSTSMSKLCNGVDLDQTKVSSATTKASRMFTKGGAFGPYLIEDLVTLPGSDAASALAGLRDALSACQQWTEPGQGANPAVSYTLAETPLPKLGDESLAFRLTSGATAAGTGEGDFAYVRHGQSLLIVMYAGVGLTSADADQWLALAQSADDKASSHGVH